MSALLSCEDARIDGRGFPLIEELTFETQHRRVGLVGDWTALFRLLTNDATLARGRVRVDGVDAGDVVPRGHLGVAPSDLAMPSGFTVAQYLGHSAELLGIGARGARDQATAALKRAGIETTASRPIGSLDEVTRRAVLLAHAAIGDPPILGVERPFDGLEDSRATSLAQVLMRVAEGKQLLVSVDDPAPVGAERNLLASLDEVVVVARRAVVGQGSPGEVLRPTPRYVVTVASSGEAFARALAESGVAVAAPPGGPSSAAGALRLVVELADGQTTGVIVQAAAALGAPLVEMIPVGLGDIPGHQT